MILNPIDSKGYPSLSIQLKEGIEYGLSLPMVNPEESNSLVFILFQVCQ